MRELDKTPSPDELLKRISRLEALVSTLTEELDKFGRWMNDGDRLIIERIKLVERDLDDAFGRIKNIELHTFPHLAGDIVHLNGIIGEGEEKAENPLDRRKP